MNIALILTLIAVGLFVVCIMLTVSLIASHVFRKRQTRAVGWSVKEALEELSAHPTAPWEVDT